MQLNGLASQSIVYDIRYDTSILSLVMAIAESSFQFRSLAWSQEPMLDSCFPQLRLIAVAISCLSVMPGAVAQG